ncbi:MAG: hypothetical protein EBR30_10870 [Cytophagia bacterium]|nr:hypothetical protein [Cytophagia bacterium]
MKTDLVALKNSKGDEYVFVYYDTLLNATIDEWVGKFETKENFVAGLNLVLSNITKYRSKKWLADLTKIEGDFSPMKDYILEFIVPEAKKVGLSFEAVVLPFDIFAMLSVQSTVDEFEDFAIKIFLTVEDAVNWLNSK